MRTRIVTLLIVAVTFLATPASARRRSVAPCIVQATGTYMQCKRSCRADFVGDKAACLSIDPGCLSQCNLDRDACLAAATASLDACVVQNGCTAIVDNGRTTCRQQVGCGGATDPCTFNPQFVQCLDPYEQLAFTCRDSCKNLWQLNGGPTAVAACHTQHQACVRACPAAH